MQHTAFMGELAPGRLGVPSPSGQPQRGHRRPRRSYPSVIWERAAAWRVEEGGGVGGSDSPTYPSDIPTPPLEAKARGKDCPSSPSMGRGTARRMGLGMPKHEVGRPRFGPLFRDNTLLYIIQGVFLMTIMINISISNTFFCYMIKGNI